jgi:hypothetical protein
MSDEPAPLAAAPSDYPSPLLPVAFVDGVSSVNWTHGVVKVYLTRLDPHVRAQGPGKEQIAAQVVMPLRSFVATALLLQRAVASMLSDGTISQDVLDEIQRADADGQRQ